jgi:hypothetical protein
MDSSNDVSLEKVKKNPIWSWTKFLFFQVDKKLEIANTAWIELIIS